MHGKHNFCRIELHSSGMPECLALNSRQVIQIDFFSLDRTQNFKGKQTTGLLMLKEKKI